MSFEKIPLFKNSLKIWKFWSLILRHDWRRYACLIPGFILNSCQFANVFTAKSSLDAYIRDAYVFVLWFNTLMRALSIVSHRFQYEKLMEEVSQIYKEIQEKEDKKMNHLLVQTGKSAKKLEILNIAIGSVASIGIILYPIFTGSRTHPFGVYVPGINTFDSPWYEIIYLYQFIISGMGCCMYIPFTSVVISFFMFGILMCKVLQYHLRNLKDLKRHEVWPEVIWCIRFHKRIISFVDLINLLTTYIYLVEFLTFGALLCALLFLLNVVHTIKQILVVCADITMIFSQVAAMYWFANKLLVQSAALANDAYDTNWFEFDLKTQKALLLFIARTQKPCAIMVGNIYPMSLEMFQSLLNVTYSYFTLLRRVYG